MTRGGTNQLETRNNRERAEEEQRRSRRGAEEEQERSRGGVKKGLHHVPGGSFLCGERVSWQDGDDDGKGCDDHQSVVDDEGCDGCNHSDHGDDDHGEGASL